MSGKWTPEQTAKFKATMAAKRAAGWSTKKGKKVTKEQSIPLDAIPEKKPRAKKKRGKKATMKHKAGAVLLVLLKSGREFRMTLEEAAELRDHLVAVF